MISRYRHKCGEHFFIEFKFLPSLNLLGRNTILKFLSFTIRALIKILKLLSLSMRGSIQILKYLSITSRGSIKISNSSSSL
jgi:hypothetical protein